MLPRGVELHFILGNPIGASVDEAAPCIMPYGVCRFSRSPLCRNRCTRSVPSSATWSCRVLRLLSALASQNVACENRVEHGTDWDPRLQPSWLSESTVVYGSIMNCLATKPASIVLHGLPAQLQRSIDIIHAEHPRPSSIGLSSH